MARHQPIQPRAGIDFQSLAYWLSSGKTLEKIAQAACLIFGAKSYVDMLTLLREELEAPMFHVLAIEKNEIVGLSSFVVCVNLDEPFSAIRYLGVHPDRAIPGLAEALIQETEMRILNFCQVNRLPEAEEPCFMHVNVEHAEVKDSALQLGYFSHPAAVEHYVLSRVDAHQQALMFYRRRP